MTPRREHRFVFLLNVAQRRLQRWMAARTQASGVTAAQSGLLFILGQRDGVLIGEAGAALDLGPPGISGLVDRMTAANLIKRREETAAARSQANTAKLLAENPQLARLKELELLQQILAGTKTTFVLGAGDLTQQIRGLVSTNGDKE